ncbi:hypothetical protein [Acinetobacter colistiniresistens]|uniref:hypothetical protein n=1 Tax=Acinetobacter colistiniresistens TaxID=280145 RepID=UPI002165FD76|nr:hypothetical protein [Acinetobacter colistiniresistens]
MQQKLQLPFPFINYERDHFPYNFEKLKLGTSYIVWWYGGILREQSHKSIRVFYQVILREVKKTENELIFGEYITENLPIDPYLTYFNLNHIFQISETHTATINSSITSTVFSLITSFNESNWCIIDVNEQKLINPDIQSFLEAYPLPPDVRDNSKLLQLTLKNNQKLFLNNIDFLAQSYKQVECLMLYPYESPHPSVDTIKNLLIKSRKIPTSDKNWQVFTEFESDCVFLGHLKYDPYTQKVIKKLTNQRIKAWLNTKSGEASSVFYPSIQPWYTDNEVEIKVKGFLCNGNIIGLNILHISDPKGSTIEWYGTTRKIGKASTSIDRIVHGELLLNKQLTLPFDD